MKCLFKKAAPPAFLPSYAELACSRGQVELADGEGEMKTGVKDALPEEGPVGAALWIGAQDTDERCLGLQKEQRGLIGLRRILGAGRLGQRALEDFAQERDVLGQGIPPQQADRLPALAAAQTVIFAAQGHLAQHGQRSWVPLQAERQRAVPPEHLAVLVKPLQK